MAKDIYHNHVKEALLKDGWTVTDDPFVLLLETERWEIDLGAEKILTAERGSEKIAVEVKSFLTRSRSYEFHRAFGQYMTYEEALWETEPERRLFLAVPSDIFDTFFSRPFYQRLLTRRGLKLLVFDPEKAEVVLWKE